MRFKDFEIRPTTFLDGHTDPNKYDLVKWYKPDSPVEVIDNRTGEKRLKDVFCYSVAHIYWNEKEPCWEFESVGTRFLNDYREGLCEYILRSIAVLDMCREAQNG